MTLVGGAGGRRDDFRHSDRAKLPERKKTHAVTARPIALAIAVRRTATSRLNRPRTLCHPRGSGSAVSRTGEIATTRIRAPAAASVSRKSSHGNQSLRVTWQINTKNKLSLQGQNGQQKRPYYGYACCNAFTTSPEATFYSESRPMYLVQSSWNSPVTSRLLVEASAGGASKNFETYLQPGMSATQPSCAPRAPASVRGYV